MTGLRDGGSSQGCGSFWKLETAGKGFSPGASRRDQPCGHLDSGSADAGLQNGEVTHLCCLSRSVLGEEAEREGRPGGGGQRGQMARFTYSFACVATVLIF